jgi:hypothetical protein
VLDGLWIGAGRWVGGGSGRDGLLELALGHPVVGHEVGDPERLDVAGLAPEVDVHALGEAALDARQLVDVRADLEEGARLRVAGELRVRDLVAPGPEGARGAGRLDAEEEVGVAAPAAVEEGRLEDDVGAARIVARRRHKPIAGPRSSRQLDLVVRGRRFEIGE